MERGLEPFVLEGLVEVVRGKAQNFGGDLKQEGAWVFGGIDSVGIVQSQEKVAIMVDDDVLNFVVDREVQRARV